MRKWLPALLVLATVVFSIAVFSRLPDPMAIHWNVRGEVDGYGSRAFGAFLFPAVIAGMWGLLVALPRIDPRRANIEKFRDTYELLIVAVVAAMCLLHVGILASALGWPIPVGRLVPITIGLLFVVLGNLLPRFRSNFFFGIRTPWTLSSESVWTKTHRAGGYMMVAVGLLLMLAGILATPLWFYVALAGSGALVVGILTYSYVLWKTEQQK
ncbi:MAG TPA: SdpI family protein [Gemmatimonadaceae bacterium]